MHPDTSTLAVFFKGNACPTPLAQVWYNHHMPARKILLALCSFLFILLPLFTFVQPASSDELDDITKQLNELNDALNKSVAATKPLQSELTRMQNQITGIKNRVVYLEGEMAIKKVEIEKGYENLGEKRKELAAAIRRDYINNSNPSPLVDYLLGDSVTSDILKSMYDEALARKNKEKITQLILALTDLERKKVELEQEQKWMLATKATLDEQSAKLDKVVKGAIAYQQEVSGKISELSAKQQEIINARSGSFTFSIGEGELADEYLSSIKGFRESAPSGYFAAFSFGAYTHRNGMSQYGARARAEKGQSVEDILKAYYPNATLKKDYAVMGTITVEGHGSMPFEDQYLQGIYEMPITWHANAQKAQAIAARTYAVRHTNNGQSSICTTEACQVFKNSKKGGAWEQAVNETKGWVLVDGGGNPVSTQYASTHGGFSNTSGWDTTDGAGGSNFIDKSYEKLGGSPWLYKSWWRKGYSNSGDTCGRSNPWLSPQEMADLVNAAIVLANTSDGRITPVTTNCWGGNPYSHDELRQISAQYGGGLGSVSGVSVSQGNGSTNEVVFQTDKGEKRLAGGSFKTAFNLRAPGYLSIPQSGFAFYNIERK